VAAGLLDLVIAVEVTTHHHRLRSALLWWIPGILGLAIGLVILLGGIAWALVAAHVASTYVAIVCLIIAGVGVMMAVPFAILGALAAIALRGIPNDLYFQIGLLTLIGLAAKNAILIVEFAVEMNRKEGKSYFAAAAEAARLRLRPIVMTSFAFVLGTIPLAIATGASANSRHSIGTGVIGGTLAATIIAIFFIPMFYWMLETLSAKLFPSKPDEAAAAGGIPTGEAAPVAPHAPGEAD